MPRPNLPKPVDQASMAKLLEEPPAPEPVPETSTPEDELTEDKVVVIRIPARYTEDKVKTLMESMTSQFHESGYRLVFTPSEVDIYMLEQTPPPADPRRW